MSFIEKIDHHSHFPLRGMSLESNRAMSDSRVVEFRYPTATKGSKDEEGGYSLTFDRHVYLRERHMIGSVNIESLIPARGIVIQEWTDGKFVFDTHITLKGNIFDEETNERIGRFLSKLSPSDREKAIKHYRGIMPAAVLKFGECAALELGKRTLHELSSNGSVTFNTEAIKEIQLQNEVKFKNGQRKTRFSYFQKPYYSEVAVRSMNNQKTQEPLGHLYAGYEFYEKYLSGIELAARGLLKRNFIPEEAVREIISPYLVYRPLR